MTPVAEFFSGGAVGVLSGLASGLLGVSPGGGLVVFSVLLLGVDQHIAQGASLVAQVPPTSLPGLRRYASAHRRIPRRWLGWLSLGYLAGGWLGAEAATLATDRALRWTYAGYLLLLDILLLARTLRTPSSADPDKPSPEPGSPALLTLGLFAGVSSGFMGIGGGLAITVGLAFVGVPQHLAQMVSLALSLIPAGAPAAWTYWSEGLVAPGAALLGMIAGLVVGTDLGARAANRISERALQLASIGFVALMTLYMGVRAIEASSW